MVHHHRECGVVATTPGVVEVDGRSVIEGVAAAGDPNVDVPVLLATNGGVRRVAGQGEVTNHVGFDVGVHGRFAGLVHRVEGNVERQTGLDVDRLAVGRTGEVIHVEVTAVHGQSAGTWCHTRCIAFIVGEDGPSNTVRDGQVRHTNLNFRVTRFGPTGNGVGPGHDAVDGRRGSENRTGDSLVVGAVQDEVLFAEKLTGCGVNDVTGLLVIVDVFWSPDFGLKGVSKGRRDILKVISRIHHHLWLGHNDHVAAQEVTGPGRDHLPVNGCRLLNTTKSLNISEIGSDGHGWVAGLVSDQDLQTAVVDGDALHILLEVDRGEPVGPGFAIPHEGLFGAVITRERSRQHQILGSETPDTRPLANHVHRGFAW